MLYASCEYDSRSMNFHREYHLFIVSADKVVPSVGTGHASVFFVQVLVDAVPRTEGKLNVCMESHILNRRCCFH